MDKKLKEFFKNLVEAPSPSGFEQPAQEVYRNFVKEFADEVKTDVHGNVIAFKKGSGKLKMMVSGHADEGLWLIISMTMDIYFFPPSEGLTFLCSLVSGLMFIQKKELSEGLLGRRQYI